MQSISQKVSPLTVSISKEFHSAQNLASMHMQITALRYMGINSMCMIDFTQLTFEGSESKAHLCCLTVWQNHCRWDNNLPHESFVESSSRARMSHHNHPNSHLYSIMNN